MNARSLFLNGLKRIGVLKGYRQSSSGNVTIEFALVLPFLLLLTFPVIDFSFVVINKINLRTAINTGMTAAMEITSLGANIETTVTNSTSIPNLTLTVTSLCQCADNTVVSCSGTCSGGSTPDRYFEITANKDVELFTNYGFLTNPFPISETATILVP